MYKSPEQRFQRTKNFYVSPSTVGLTESSRCGSPKFEGNLRDSKLSHAVRSQDGFNSRVEHKDQVEGKIESLQKMLENEKSKRQTEFASLFKMINSLKKAKGNKNQNEELSFVYNELQFPMTPRVRNRDSDVEGEENSFSQHSYTPVHETVSKARQSRFRNNERQADNYRSSLEDFSLKSLEILLQKIQRQAEFNNRNIFRIQQEISSIRSVVSKTKPRSSKPQQVPIEIQKLVRDSTQSLKTQMESERNLMKKLISQQIQQQLSQKLPQIAQFQAPSQDLSTLHQKFSSLTSYIDSQLHHLDEKTNNQVYTMNEILQQKFTFFKESLLDQVFKNSSEDNGKVTAELTAEMERVKERIREMEESNGEFYNELEKTMENIQGKLRMFKTGAQSEKEMKDMKEQWEADLMRKLRQEQQTFFDQITNEFNTKLAGHLEQSKKQLKPLTAKVDKLQDHLVSPYPSKPKLTKYNSLNTPSYENPNPEPSSPYPEHSLHEVRQASESHSPYSNITFSMEENYQQRSSSLAEYEQILQLVSENCTFLEERNCAIEEDMGEVVAVLNNIVGKLNNLM